MSTSFPVLTHTRATTFSLATLVTLPAGTWTTASTLVTTTGQVVDGALAESLSALPAPDAEGHTHALLIERAATDTAAWPRATLLLRTTFTDTSLIPVVVPAVTWQVTVSDNTPPSTNPADALPVVTPAYAAVLRGDVGPQGVQGPPGPQGPAGPPGTTTWAGITDKPSVFPPDVHSHTSAQIVDASAVGRAVLMASDAASALAAIGAGTSSFSGAYADLSGKPTLGHLARRAGRASRASQRWAAQRRSTLGRWRARWLRVTTRGCRMSVRPLLRASPARCTPPPARARRLMRTSLRSQTAPHRGRWPG